MCLRSPLLHTPLCSLLVMVKSDATLGFYLTPVLLARTTRRPLKQNRLLEVTLGIPLGKSQI